jgi:hypothetical protein
MGISQKCQVISAEFTILFQSADGHLRLIGLYPNTIPQFGLDQKFLEKCITLYILRPTINMVYKDVQSRPYMAVIAPSLTAVVLDS